MKKTITLLAALLVVGMTQAETVGETFRALMAAESYAEAQVVADANGLTAASFRARWEQDESAANAFAEVLLNEEVTPHYCSLIAAYMNSNRYFLNPTEVQATWLLKGLSAAKGAPTAKARSAQMFTRGCRKYYTAEQLRVIYRDLEYRYKPVFTTSAPAGKWTLYVTSLTD